MPTTPRRIRFIPAVGLMTIAMTIRLAVAEETGSHPEQSQLQMPPNLQASLHDPDATVRHHAVVTLFPQFGIPARFALAQAMNDPEAMVRLAAADALAYIGPAAADVVGYLVQALDDPGIVRRGDTIVRVRDVVWAAVIKIGSPAVPSLIAALQHKGLGLRRASASVLEKITPPPEQALPVLARALEDEDIELRMAVTRAIAHIDPRHARKAVPLMINALDNRDRNVRYSACRALGMIGPGAIDAVPTLIGMLASHEESDRRAACIALIGIGPEASRAVPALVKLLDDHQSYIREHGILALGKIGGAMARQALERSLDDAVPNIRWYTAVPAIGELAERDPQAIPILAKALGNSDLETRRAAARVFVRLGLRAKPARKALENAMNDPDVVVRSLTAEALQNLQRNLSTTGH